MSKFQKTIAKTVSFSGVALHSGDKVHVEMRPAPANTGVVFQRVDLPHQPYIKASSESVFDTSLATRLGTPEAYVSTVEHLLSALFGFGIDNIFISLNNSELPILDGSAAPFLMILSEAGIVELKDYKKLIVIKKPIEVVDEKNPSRFIRIEPSRTPIISYGIDFLQTQKIGKQFVSLNYTPQSFCEEFSYARTFCLKEEIEFMRSRGLAKGGSMENAIVVSGDELLNKSGLRHSHEFVRHKVLDCIGDLYLLGAPILGHVIAFKAGHDLHNKLAQAILVQEDSRKIIIPSESQLSWKSVQSIFSAPKSLLDIKHPLTDLATG